MLIKKRGDPAESARASQGGLSTPVRASNDKEGRHGDRQRPGRADQSDFGSG